MNILGHNFPMDKGRMKNHGWHPILVNYEIETVLMKNVEIEQWRCLHLSFS